MTDAVCPYCRCPIDSNDSNRVICEGCDTPHHRDCYEENGGCTVFGCRCAPADEPKLRVSPPDFTGVTRAPASPVTPVASPMSYSILGLTQSPAASVQALRIPAPVAEVGADRHKGKMTFVMLGVLLGGLGAHNFYAGYKKKAVAQLCITALTLGYGAPMAWIWALIDVCTVERDSEGIQFKS